MARSIHCPQCGIALNLPPQAIGRRVKCPKCNERFIPSANEGSPPLSGSALEKAPNLSPDASMELSKKYSSADLPVIPTAAGHLRETFDLPMMTEAASGPGNDAPRPGHPDRHAGDALALFDNAPAEPRRKRGAEARATHRRCPTCGGYVPQGMSLCNTCGVDLDTGTKIDLEDDLISSGPVRQKGIPLTIAIIGGICMALSVSLTFAAIVASATGQTEFRYFIPIAAFGIYASTQFLRQKNVKLVMIALTLGALIDLCWLVALPIYNANAQAPVKNRTILDDDPDVDDVMIQSVKERLDLDKVKGGLVIIGLYAGLSILIISPFVQKHFHHK